MHEGAGYRAFLAVGKPGTPDRNTEAFSDRIIDFLAKGEANARKTQSAANEAYGDYLALDSAEREALDDDEFEYFRKLRREADRTKELHLAAVRDLRRFLLTSKTIRQTNWPFGPLQDPEA